MSAALLFAATPAQAVPSSKLQQAKAIKSQIDRLDNRVEVASERYNSARIKHANLVVKKRKAAARVAKAEKRMGQLQRHLSVRANSMYRTGRLGMMEVLVGAKSFEDFSATWDLLKSMNSDDAKAVAELRVVRAQARAAHADLTAAEKQSAAQVRVMAAQKRSIVSQLAERKRKLVGVESEIAALERAEEAARAARARAWVAKASDSSDNDRFPAPTRAARSEVVSVARRYLGAPYRWAAAGPNSFDCSGFTMFVYRQVGVSLPHSSRAQIGYGDRVSRGDLQPGDLVFFGSPIHHVGIYVGGGMMIHAPHTGAVVEIAPLHGDYAGAARP